ncbi:hypothetical protein B0J12DRAFT_293593 [Macrophomina phaseolina]|uniref:Uncharacterized protein n=1 Tax=Macrophomina phaseolina TaxID=35725 RepID=A0ABQ8GRU1_9PEZI|nr:hypothetical protein B0J12DRAFT_293593 [Macrophomina phaseolina]
MGGRRLRWRETRLSHPSLREQGRSKKVFFRVPISDCLWEAALFCDWSCLGRMAGGFASSRWLSCMALPPLSHEHILVTSILMPRMSGWVSGWLHGCLAARKHGGGKAKSERSSYLMLLCSMEKVDDGGLLLHTWRIPDKTWIEAYVMSQGPRRGDGWKSNIKCR